MDYNEYRNEYQKIILKESLKRGISVKQRLMETIRNSDKQEMLELFLQTNDFDGQIKSDELMLQDLGDDEEFKELIENDIEATKELKKTAEDRLKELKEQEKDKDEEKEQDDEKWQESEDDEHDEHSGKAHNSEQNSSSVNNDVENYQDIQFIMPISRDRFPVYGSQEYYVANIKHQVNISINLMQRIKANIDRCPSPMMLMYMDGEKEFFDGVQDLARNIHTMPGCDEELKMLTEEQIKAAQDVKDTVDKYIEQYRERAEKDSKDKDEETTSLKEMEDKLQQQEDKEKDEKETDELEQEDEELEQDDDGLEQESEELEQDDDSTPRKSWELPPKQKEEIQRSTQQVAQEHMERQANPQPVQEQPTIEASSGFDR